MTGFARSIAGRVFLLLLFGITGSVALTLHAAAHGVKPERPMILLAVFGICTLALAYGAARISTRPLRALRTAATRLGSNIESTPLPETGPTEVRDAAIAFNVMQARILRDMRERTSMLAAITHDLQTPLTRLRLRLEKVTDDDLREKLIEDLANMGATISEGLELARSLEAQEPMQRLDLDSLLDSACIDAQDAGEDVVLEGTTGASVLAAPNALRRCIMNLLDNAVAYGRYARVRALRRNGFATVIIRDDGPGIPEDQMESVFEPFFRLESSRSRETGGTGLGLSIARNIIERHGGTIRLRNHPGGGLEVTLELPAV